MDEDIRKLTKEEFPPQLFETPEPPEQLFIYGEMPGVDSVLLTVVGSRKYSHYGKEICEKLIGGLAGYDITIVSGLALGIDTIAHKAALSAGLHTIAVPGSGLNEKVLYPATNKLLAREIVKSGGGLLSEFDPDFHATPWSFPQRNRIMAGLSHATLVIEAENRSGTLITARLALDYNKDVLAVPGSVFSQNSQGTNRLLRQGATPITSSIELLDALGFETKESTPKQKELDFQNCSPEEKQVLEIIAEPCARDELIRALEVPVSQANILLSAMEIKGLIKETGGKIRQN
jgi:DNA processing protein